MPLFGWLRRPGPSAVDAVPARFAATPAAGGYEERRRQRRLEAERAVAARVADHAPHDPDARASLDPWIDWLTSPWHDEDERRHDADLRDLATDRAGAEAALAEAARQLEHAKTGVGIAWHAWVQARQRLGGELPARAQNGDGPADGSPPAVGDGPPVIDVEVVPSDAHPPPTKDDPDAGPGAGRPFADSDLNSTPDDRRRAGEHEEQDMTDDTDDDDADGSPAAAPDVDEVDDNDKEAVT